MAGSTSAPHIKSLKQMLNLEPEVPSASVRVSPGPPVPLAAEQGLGQSHTYCGLEAFPTGQSTHGGQVSLHTGWGKPCPR